MMSRGEHQQELTETKYDEKGLTAEQNLSNPESSSALPDWPWKFIFTFSLARFLPFSSTR